MVPGRKYQSCRKFDGDHFYVLDIEFGRIFSLSRPTFGTFLIFHVCGQFFENLKNFEVPGRKKQSCCEFDGDYSYVLDIEFGRKLFSPSHPTLRIFLILHLSRQFIENLKENKVSDDKT